MNLYLKNIGKINSTSIELDGITILAGENDTGKTTVSRILFTLLHHLYSAKDKRYSLNSANTELFTSYLKRNLQVEFHNKIKNIFNDDLGEIKLQIEDEILTISIDNDNNIAIQTSNDLSIPADIIDMSNPIAALCYSASCLSRHKTDTIKLPQIIYDKISSVCKGDIILDTSSDVFVYRVEGTDKTLSLSKLSSGILTFGTLKKLLLERIISYHSTLLIDTLEDSLHPKWQLLLAELIILLYKELNIRILFTIYSPYFINAIEVYSKKYNVQDNCRYYLAQNMGDFSSIQEVTQNREAIYRELAAPFQDLENIEYSIEC